MPDPRKLSRRAVLGGALGLAATAASRTANAQITFLPIPMPVVFLSHGSPRLPLDTMRSGELRRWGETLEPKPKGIVVMTPHFGERHLELGPTGRGFAMYNMPGWMKRQLPQDLDYPSPPSEALGARVEKLLGEPMARSKRRGFDHTTWMPLSYLYARADVPVVEVAYPYRPDAELFALGKKLAPLRNEGILFVASGGMTHNLASMDLAHPDQPVPRWSQEFDAWAAETLAAKNVDALLDWRKKAPAADLAHPDDGGHYRVLIVALGVAFGLGTPREVRFPIAGYESTMSKRGVQIG